MLSRCLCVMAILLLAGCAAPLRIEAGRLVPPAGHGYVIAAVTLETSANSHGDAAIQLDGPAGRLYLYADIGVDMIRAPGKETDGAGKLHVVAVPAGRYRVSELYGSWADDSNGFGMRNLASFELDERFDLAAGQVVYLGDYHLELNFMPSYRRSDTRRRDFNELAERRGVKDPSNITALLPLQHLNKQPD